MRIAVVGATGNIGSGLSRDLLAAGHQVRALSRGGRALDELVKLGAEPFIGSFDEGTPGLKDFFKGMDAAFTMVRSDWSNVGHYPTVASRLSEAIKGSPVSLVVNLSSFGADLKENAAHSSDFFALERALSGISTTRTVHVRAGWFMENFLSLADGVAKYGQIATMVDPDIELPCMAIDDVRRALAQEFMNPAKDCHVIREVKGPGDVTMYHAARSISSLIGRCIRVRYISPGRQDAKDEFLYRGGTEDQWTYRVVSNTAFNDRRVRFYEPRTRFDTESMQFDEFLRNKWLPTYNDAIANGHSRAESFQTWLCRLPDGQ